jgi:sugar phosphate isomerase/epimerase
MMNTSRRQCVKLLAAVPLFASRSAAAESPALFRPAICAYSFRNELKSGRMTYADIIRMAADTGADGIDLTAYWLADTKDETLFALKKLAYRLSVSLYSIGIRARMVQPTSELRAAEVATVRQWLDVAERLGAAHIRVFGGNVPKGATEAQAMDWAAETLKRCAEEAGHKGITLGVEDDGGITTTAEQTVRIVRKADSPWVGVNLDIGNFPNDAYRQIEICAPLASNVHFKSHVYVDGRRQTADWPKILGILRKSGYLGYLALEYEENEDPRSAVPQLLARLRESIGAVPRLGALARR